MPENSVKVQPHNWIINPIRTSKEYSDGTVSFYTIYLPVLRKECTNQTELLDTVPADVSH